MIRPRVSTLLAALCGVVLVTGLMPLIPTATATAATTAAAPAFAPGSVNVDFGTTTTTPPSGYTLDDGAAFNATPGFGWENNSTGAPLSIVGNGRQRNVHPGQLGDTLMQMQLATNSSGVHTPAKWMANVANGTYNLTVGIGDPSYTDSVDVLNANGTNIANFTPTTGTPQKVVTTTVTITGGTLTLDPTGGTNTKIDYVNITPQSSPPPSLAVDFGTTTTTPPSGYTLDDGAAFNTTAGFGWENNSTGAPLSIVGNGRQRNVHPGQLGDTLMQMQLATNSSGVHTPAKWMANVANGTYNLTVGIGDPSYTDSVDVLNANGTNIANFTPTTGTPQKVVTTTVTITGGTLTLDPTGGTNTKIDYINLVPVGPSPTVTVTPSGTTNSSGAFIGSATVTINASETGGTITSVNYTVNGGPTQTYTAPFTISTAGNYTVSATATDANNVTSSPVTSTFSVVSATSLQVVSPDDFLGVGSRLVFSTVKNQTTPDQTITLNNTGTTALNVTGLTFSGTNSGDFKLCTGQATSFSIAANGSATVCIDYRPLVDAVTNGTYTSQATLTIASNDATAPSYPVTLGGLNSKDYGSFHEPNLQQIFQALGYTDNVGVTNSPQGNSISGTSSPVGDEILAPYFKALNNTQPVHLYPVGHYSGQDNNDSNPFGWYAKGSSTNNYLYNFQGGANGSNGGYGQNQLLLPAIQACNGTPKFTCSGTTAFNPSGSFGVVDDYPGYVNHSDDALNGAQWHDMRAYPAKDGNGNVIPGSYLIGDDIGSPVNNSAKNWDYQDFSFLLTNATPDTSASQPTAGAYNQALSSFPGNAGGVDGSGFTSAQGTVNASQISYSNNNINIVTSNDSNTSHTNALQLGVNAGVPFRVQSRLVGPFSAINAGADQQGIYFGPNANNYIKAEVEWQTGDSARHLTIWQESNGTGSIINSIDLPGGNANTIDLRIDIDPSPQISADYNGNPIAHVSYALNGSTTFTNLQTSDISIPPSWITANTPAGLVTSNQQGGSPFTATYANFSIARIPYFTS